MATIALYMIILCAFIVIILIGNAVNTFANIPTERWKKLLQEEQKSRSQVEIVAGEEPKYSAKMKISFQKQNREKLDFTKIPLFETEKECKERLRRNKD